MNDANVDPQETTSHQHSYGLLIAGIVLLLVPLVFLAVEPDLYEKAKFFLRVIAALGGALVGACLPGILDVKLPYAKAGGALAVFLIIFGVNPPKEAFDAIAPETPGQISPDTASELLENISVSQIPNEKEKTVSLQPKQAAVLEKASTRHVWEQVMAISWVKPSDWLGRHYHLEVDKGIFLWPTNLNEKEAQATIIVNDSSEGRQEGKKYLDSVEIEVGKGVEFEAKGEKYLIKLLSIRNAGRRPTVAGYFQAFVQKGNE